MTRTVLLFAKPPRIGLAKTRLARSLSPAEARRIAFFCLSQTLRAARDRRWTLRLHIAPDSRLTESLGGLWPVDLARFSQGRGDLGDRLAHGLAEAPRGPAVLIGMDTPDISAALIWRAFAALRTHDAVFGPARDGGFWLFGLNKPMRQRKIFSPVRWSGPHAMADLAGNLPQDWQVAHLPRLIDIDEADDWREWRKRAGE